MTIILSILFLSMLAIGSVAVTYAATVTIDETLDTNTDSASAALRKIRHTAFNEAAELNASSTPPATKTANFVQALTAGAATINLAALTGTNGATVDLTGLKVQIVRVKNLGANTLTVVAGASNGHSGIFPASGGLPIPPGGHVQLYSNDNGDDVAAGDRTWDLSGTGTQTSEWTIVAG